MGCKSIIAYEIRVCHYRALPEISTEIQLYTSVHQHQVKVMHSMCQNGSDAQVDVYDQGAVIGCHG